MSKKSILTVSALALGAALAAVPLVAAAKSEGWRMDHDQRMERMADRAGPGRMGGRDGGPKLDFSKADANDDGVVTVEEMTARRAAEIAALDADGDGFVTAEEMVDRTRGVMQARMLERAQRRLERLDADDDGRLAVSELPEPPFDRIFAAIDADGDGAVTEAEFEAFAALRGGRDGAGGTHDKGPGRWMRGQH